MKSLSKSPPLRDKAWLIKQRGDGCVVTGRAATDSESVVACHVRAGQGGGMGLKPGDDCTLPMINSMHQLQGQMGEIAFWRKYVPGDILMRAVVQWANERHSAWRDEQ